MFYDLNLNPILEKVNIKELQPLVDIILEAKPYSFISLGIYKKDKLSYITAIASEVRALGGNTFANIFRGGVGPEYKEIVCDVAKEIKAPYNTTWNIEKIEDSIIETIMTEIDLDDEKTSELFKDCEDFERMSKTEQSVVRSLLADYFTLFIKSSASCKLRAVVHIAHLRKSYNTPTCPHCKKMIYAEGKFCPECGGSL